jgi:hypothetical protein
MPGPVLVTGNVLTFRVWSTCGNQAAVTTHHYILGTSSGAGVTLSNAATVFDGTVAALYKNILSAQSSYRGVQAYVNQLPLPLPQSTVANAGVGTGGAIGNATQVTGITSWLTAIAGPGGRGRTYWPFPATAADSASPVPDAAYITAAEDLSQAMIDLVAIPGSGGGSINCTMGLKRGPNKAGVPQPFATFEQFVTQPKWATQKRRGLGYGRANVSPI